MSGIDEAWRLANADPLDPDVREKLEALEKGMNELEKHEMIDVWEVLMDNEDQQGLNIDEGETLDI